ncbi:hypothetical protein [Endozoicomonas sp. Mp262]|uniref:hypothetical protein n=1 Tax=Endozoicomonas sp. Mp262 TaxID=2919499 RepID=UPI0021D7EFB6
MDINGAGGGQGVGPLNNAQTGGVKRSGSFNGSDVTPAKKAKTHIRDGVNKGSKPVQKEVTSRKVNKLNTVLNKVGLTVSQSTKSWMGDKEQLAISKQSMIRGDKSLRERTNNKRHDAKAEVVAQFREAINNKIQESGMEKEFAQMTSFEKKGAISEKRKSMRDKLKTLKRERSDKLQERNNKRRFANFMKVITLGFGGKEAAREAQKVSQDYKEMKNEIVNKENQIERLKSLKSEVEYLQEQMDKAIKQLKKAW